MARFTTPDGSGLTQMAVSPDETVLLGSSRGRIWEWTPQASAVREFVASPVDRAPILNLQFDEKGGLVLQQGRQLIFQDERGQRKTVSLPKLSFLAISPSGGQLAGMGGDPPIVFLDSASGEKTHRVDRQVWVDEMHFSPDGRRLATARFGRLYLWDAETGKLLWKTRLEGNVQGVAFAPNPTFLLAAVNREGLWVVDAESGEIRDRLRRSHSINDDSSLHRFSVSPDGTLVAETLPDRHIEIWETYTGRPVLLLEKHPSEIADVHFLPDGLHLVSGDSQGNAYLWDLASADFAGSFDAGRPYSQEELGRLWRMLGESRGHASWSAMVALKHRPDQALPLIDHPPNDDLLIQGLIERMDHDQFSDRQSAYRALRQLSLNAEPFLREALDTTKSAELRSRARRLLAYLEGPQRESQRRLMEESRNHRQLRTIQLLKWIGTPEAKRRLEAIRDSAQDPAVRNQSQAALKRLNGKGKED